MAQVSYSRLALLVLIVLSVFFVELGAARLWDRDEPRNARASHEMLARGDWIVPTFNGSLRDHKPILLYWGQMLSYLTLGESEFTARLPSALCALLTVGATAVLASRLSGKRRGISHEGFWAAGAMATCSLFVMAGRAATPDSCLIAFSTLGIAALVLSTVTPAHPYSSGAVGRGRWLPAMWGYTMLGLAMLAKGPVGLVLPLAVVHLWWMICRHLQSAELVCERPQTLGQRLSAGLLLVWRIGNPLQCWRAIVALRTIPGVLLSLLAAVPWYAAVGLETNGEFLRGFFLEHNVGRAMGAMEGHDGSLLFYPAALLIGTFPWSLWLIPLVMWGRQASRESVVQRQMVVLATVWIAVYLFAFSMAGTKLPSYITPCYAAAALVIGGFWRQYENARWRPTLTLRRVAHSLTIVIGLFIAVGVWWLSQQEAMPLLARAAAAGLVIAAVGGLGWLWEIRCQPRWVPLTWLAGAAAFQVLLFGFGAKSVDGYRHDLAVLAEVKQPSDARHWLSIGGMEPSWVHYLGDEIVEVTRSESDPLAWEQVELFLEQFPEGRILAVGEATHERLQQWQSHRGESLVEVAQAPRFLRPGMLRVFARPAPSETTPSETALDLPPPLRTAGRN